LAAVWLITFAITARGAEQTPAKPVVKAPALDLDFLEYLGTLESDDGNWTEVVNIELPKPPPANAKSKVDTSATKSKAQTEAAAKSAGSEK
jgi:hypothetical protein